jgi:putative ABC transport system substrate-binding protein
MRRREFIAGIGSAAAWPAMARAQQGVRRVGVLAAAAEATARLPRRLREELPKLGWIEGRNLRLDVRGGDHKTDQYRTFAAELVNLRADVIVTTGTPATTAVQQLTQTIPIVFLVVSDPLITGLVRSVARPEGNTTGISAAFFSLGQKWVQLLKEAAPSIERVAALYNPELVPQVGSYWTSIEEAARALAVQAISIPYSNADDIERAIGAFAAVPNGSLIIEATGFVGDNHQLFSGLAKKYRLPAIYPNRNYVADGGLMSYSSNDDEAVRRLSSHIDRILRGAKPGDLPVEYPTRFDLVINLKAAEAIGLAVPQSMLLRADEVIE